MQLFLLLFLHSWCSRLPFATISLQSEKKFLQCFKAKLLAMNTHSFPLLRKPFLAFITERGIFIRYQILDHFFFFSTLKVFSYCLLVSMTSDEKFATTWVTGPLCILGFLVFSLLSSFFFPQSWIFNSLIVMHLSIVSFKLILLEIHGVP